MRAAAMARPLPDGRPRLHVVSDAMAAVRPLLPESSGLLNFLAETTAPGAV